MALTEKALQELARKNLIDPGQLKKALAREVSGEAGPEELLRVPFRIGATLNRSMCHASRFFRELRDSGTFYAGKCPACGHVLFPPIRPVCLRCIKKGVLVEYEPLEFGSKVEGTILAWSKLVRGTSKHVGQGVLYPVIVRVDGADNGHWQIVLASKDDEVTVGARVKSVLLEEEKRTGEVSDYAFEPIRREQ